MSDTPRLTPPSTYLDFGALGQLRGEASRDPGKAVRATAEQFEAFFIQQMLKTMRDAVEKSELVDNGKADLYQDLMDKEVSLQMTRRGGIGLADMLEKQMTRLQQAASTEQALQSRGTPAPALPLQPPAEALRLKPAAARAYDMPASGPYRIERPDGGRP